jgi:hypothetical protein
LTFGIRVFDAGGAPVWDSVSAAGGVIADVQTIPANTAMTFTYPLFAGRAFGVLSVSQPANPLLTMDDALGYPRVQAAAMVVARTIMVMVF